MHHAELDPALACRLIGGPRSMSAVVDEVLRSPAMRNSVGARSPEAIDLLGLALNEVLYSVHEFAGEQTEADGSCVELWAEATVMIVTVKFRGAALPSWLLANWDRGREPAMLAPPHEAGWGWLLVREALDSVSHVWADSQQILFLERRT